jgi:glucosamine--fructose-6-phosphate aminotransferase (isomerizing)
MCGIAGATGFDNVVPRVYEGIRALEYRGYDSCGIAVINGTAHIEVRKDVGGVEEVAHGQRFLELSGNVAIAHTRWATHGGVTKPNAHPHTSMAGDFAVVHNGIIDNYRELKANLVARGVTFRSETDTEVVAHLIAAHFDHDKDLLAAFTRTIADIRGSYALAVVSTHLPGTILCAKSKSPLSIGLGDDANYIGSDCNAFIEKTRRAVVLDDDEIAIVSANDYFVRNGQGAVVVKEPLTLHWDAEQARKGGYPHYMLKEIHEQPQAVRAALGAEASRVTALAELLANARHIYLAGVGTTHYVATAAQYTLAQVAQRKAIAISTDEFRYLARPEPGDVVLAISQSGETYDTLDAIRFAKSCGAKTAAVVNVIGSSLERMVDVSVLQMSGPEISVISTKAALAQLVVLSRVTAMMARKTGGAEASSETANEVERALTALPDALLRCINEHSGFLNTLARRTADVDHWLFLGRGPYAAIASECALKMKEVAYRHAEGMPAGFLKHGTLALIDDAVRTLLFVPPRSEARLYELTQSSAHEIRARGGHIVAITFDDDDGTYDEAVRLPNVSPWTAPLLELVAGQLFSYFTAVALRRSIDKPRSLAKSVTVP